MASKRKDEPYVDGDGKISGAKRVFGLGAVAAVSAIAGGLAVAWWHRKILEKLQNPILMDEKSSSQILDSGLESDDVDGF